MNRELQLHSICRRKRRAYHRGLAHKIFPNLLKRNFSPEQPNRMWCTDFTYMTLTNGTVRYNCSMFSYDWYNQVRPHSYNGYLTPFEKRVECTIKQWCYK